MPGYTPALAAALEAEAEDAVAMIEENPVGTLRAPARRAADTTRARLPG